jgi:cation diffusion facilitator CzcD-associated flavoprotein CzcO
MEHIPVVVVGGGQAGLATSRELTQAGVEHVVLERGRVGQTWRGRWDSFCLVTPNWTVQLPGYPYDGDDPDGFMPRDEIVAYLERYASAVGVPVREGVGVDSLATVDGGGLVVGTTAGEIRVDDVVLATGAYQRPHRPAGAAELPAGLLQIDAEDYTNPADLPVGAVLVIGSGQSGCQIAEELHEAGRAVVLACGKAPWLPRRVGGRDVVWWAVETGFLEGSLESLPVPQARLGANFLTTGHHGGADLHFRTLQALGVTLAGHFLGAADGVARFAPDLSESVAWGDDRQREFRQAIDRTVAERGLEPPEIPPIEPFDAAGAPTEVDLTRFGAVIFAGGFRPDYRAWLPWPDAFDGLGFPIHRDGSSTVIPGLHFVGVHFLRKRKSSIFFGVGEDAALVARTIAARQPARQAK